jgi:hypothetical protein
LLYESAEDTMKQDTSVWATFFLAVAAALALSFLLTGCASSHREPAPGAAASTWGTCDRSRMVSVMLVCRQTRTEPVSDLSR